MAVLMVVTVTIDGGGDGCSLVIVVGRQNASRPQRHVAARQGISSQNRRADWKTTEGSGGSSGYGNHGSGSHDSRSRILGSSSRGSGRCDSGSRGSGRPLILLQFLERGIERGEGFRRDRWLFRRRQAATPPLPPLPPAPSPLPWLPLSRRPVPRLLLPGVELLLAWLPLPWFPYPLLPPPLSVVFRSARRFWLDIPSRATTCLLPCHDMSPPVPRQVSGL